MGIAKEKEISNGHQGGIQKKKTSYESQIGLQMLVAGDPAFRVYSFGV